MEAPKSRPTIDNVISDEAGITDAIDNALIDGGRVRICTTRFAGMGCPDTDKYRVHCGTKALDDKVPTVKESSLLLLTTIEDPRASTSVPTLLLELELLQLAFPTRYAVTAPASPPKLCPVSVMTVPVNDVGRSDGENDVTSVAAYRNAGASLSTKLYCPV